MSVLRTAWSRALDVFFPPRCLGCGGLEGFFCEACLGAAPRATGERCWRCWRRGRLENCPDCYRLEPAFSNLRAPFQYAGAPRSAVLALKFSGVSSVAPVMAEGMAGVLRHWSPDVGAIVPVPLGTLRQRTRGFNQSELLAREVGRLVGLPVQPRALRRVRRTQPQARQPGVEARQANVSGAFALGRRPVAGNVLLVDDVATTCATLDACARVLLEGGAGAVYGLTFAREG